MPFLTKPSLYSIAIFLGILLFSCRKNRGPEPQSPVESNLELRLAGGYLSGRDVDSAVILWELNGLMERRTIHFASDSFRVPLHSLPAGRGTMTIQLFSRLANQGKRLQFERRWEQEVTHSRDIIVWGPESLFSQHWMPRVMIQELNWTGVTAIVGLRPEDPYFSVRNIPAQWPSVGLARNYYASRGGQFVAGKVWNGGGAGGHIEDRQFFRELEVQVGGRNWQWAEIDLDIFNPSDGSGYSISFSCDR